MVERVLAAIETLVEEARRRDVGEPPDRSLDVPLAMLVDLAEERGIAVLAGAEVDRLVEELHPT